LVLERDDGLFEVGFPSYAPVLRGPVWNTIPDRLFSSHTKPFHFAGWFGCRFIRRFFRQQRSRQHVGLDVVSPSYYREDEF